MEKYKFIRESYWNEKIELGIGEYLCSDQKILFAQISKDENGEIRSSGHYFLRYEKAKAELDSLAAKIKKARDEFPKPLSSLADEYLNAPVIERNKLFSELLRLESVYGQPGYAVHVYHKLIEKCKNDAAKSNNEVVIKESLEYCNDPDKECTWDSVTVVVTPEGELKENRDHMY